MVSDKGRYWLFGYEALTAGSLTGEWVEMKNAGVSFIKQEFIDSSIDSRTQETGK